VVLLLGSAPTLRAATVTATWDPNPEPDIAGYILSYGPASGVYDTSVDVGNVTAWPLTLTDGQRYYFAARAYNNSGLISPFSAETVFDASLAISITSLSPPMGPPGTAVTIAGINLGAIQGASTVTFNGTTATPTAWSPTTLIVPVPAGATTGNVVVTVGGVASNGLMFTVTSQAVVENLAIGLGQSPGGAELQMRGGASALFAVATSLGNLLSPYDLTGGEYHVAAGDVDGDGLDEIVVGFGVGGMGWLVVLDDAQHNYAVLKWIQIDWPDYNATNGTVYPAVGDIDGDGRAEIVAGLGTGGYGLYQIFDDALGNYASLGWGWVDWSDYNAAVGETHPAVGDVDGDGRAEIILGLGRGGAGLLQVVNYTASGVVPNTWLVAGWPEYNAANGATWPAAGDVNGDGLAEVVVGLGAGSSGWLQEFATAAGSLTLVNSIQVGGDQYDSANGETHPAIGNVDGDAAAELVVGLGASPGNPGSFVVLDDANSGFSLLSWQIVGPAVVATFPAVGRFR
jgi:hypothetical protein